MKTITDDFVDSILSVNPKWTRTVWYKRRYFSQTSNAYVWESSWTQLPEDQVQSISEISWQLDSERLNQFTVSSLSLVLSNPNKVWLPDNRSGYLAPDSTATKGYEAFWMKFQIRMGVEIFDGTTETVTMFTGLLTDFIDNSLSGTVEMVLSGLEALLVNADAERVSTTQTLASIGTGNGSATDFTTTEHAVGQVQEVYVSGVKKRQGADYTVSQLNSPTLGAKVSFTVAPANTAPITATYFYWQTSKKFEELVTSLAVEAGISNYSVSPVIFASSIQNRRTYQTQADWESASSSTAIDTTTLVNSIKLDFASTSARQSQTFGDSTSGWSVAGSWTLNNSGGYLFWTGGPGGTVSTIYRSLTTGSGRWDWGNNFNNGAGPFSYFFMAQDVNSSYSPTILTSGEASQLYHGYLVRFAAESGGDYVVRLMRADGSGVTPTSLDSATVTKDASDHTITVIRYPSGLMIVKFDGTEILSATDTTYTTGSYFGAFAGNKLFKNSTVYTPATTLTGTWIGPTFDSGATPSAWGQYTKLDALGGGTITHYSRASADDVTYDADVAIDSNGVVSSTLRRYARVKIVMVSTLTENDDPYVTNASIGSSTTATVVTVANFTGLSVYDAISLLAQFSDYEFGFTSDEYFFFRPKDVSSNPDFELARKDLAIAVTSVTPGWDRAYSKVRASYGAYVADATDDGGWFKSPIKRFLRKRLDLDGGNVFISDDADVASGVALSFLARYKKPRKRVKIQTKLMPFVELSDVLEVTFDDNKPKGWFLGDTSQEIGDESLQLYGGQEQTLYQFTGKVIGVRFDTENKSCEIDLEEVLS